MVDVALQKYAVVDLEMNGGSHSRRIIEVAIVLYDGVERVLEYSTLVNPGCAIDSKIADLTGITTEMVEKSPSFDAIAYKVYHLLKDRVFVAHNVSFDDKWLRKEFRRSNIFWRNEKLCTFKLYKTLYSHLEGFSLAKLCDELHIPLLSHHRAGEDALATGELLSKALQEKPIATNNLIEPLLESKFIPPLLNRIDITSLMDGGGVLGVVVKDEDEEKVIYFKAVNSIYNACVDWMRKHSKTDEFQNVSKIVSYRVGGVLSRILVQIHLSKKTTRRKKRRRSGPLELKDGYYQLLLKKGSENLVFKILEGSLVQIEDKVYHKFWDFEGNVKIPALLRAFWQQNHLRFIKDLEA